MVRKAYAFSHTYRRKGEVHHGKRVNRNRDRLTGDTPEVIGDLETHIIRPGSIIRVAGISLGGSVAVAKIP